MSTQLCATWHNDSLDMVVLPSTGASRYHNCCIDGGTSLENFGHHLVHVHSTFLAPNYAIINLLCIRHTSSIHLSVWKFMHTVLMLQ